jgi:hypothetical protein
VIDRLRAGFAIARVCVVADRGMISAEAIAELGARSKRELSRVVAPGRCWSPLQRRVLILNAKRFRRVIRALLERTEGGRIRGPTP